MFIRQQHIGDTSFCLRITNVFSEKRLNAGKEIKLEGLGSREFQMSDSEIWKFKLIKNCIFGYI